MGKRKRASSPARASLLQQAVTAYRGALHEAQRRLPADLRRQVERSLREGQKTFTASLRQVQSRLNRAATQADVDRLARRIEELSRKVDKLSGRGSARPARRPARPPKPTPPRAG